MFTVSKLSVRHSFWSSSTPLPSSTPPNKDCTDIDPKKAAKFFANKFATGSSVSKNPQGEDEIFIQGDVADEVEDLILDEDDKKAFAVFLGKVSGNQIEVVDEGKLKKKNWEGSRLRERESQRM